MLGREKEISMIRAFEEKDRALYLWLTDQFYQSDAVLEPISKKNRILTFEEMIKSDRYIDGVVIEREGRTVGFALMAKTYSQEAGGLVVWLEELFILEEYRGCGIGGEFFDYFFEHYKEAARFRLDVVEDHKDVIHFYKKHGFSMLDYAQMVYENKK